jgi:hypothetical protein
VFDWLAEAVQSMPLPSPAAPITVLDLGSSEGRNSLAVMNFVAEGIRRRSAAPILTVYSDLPSNNFNQLFLNIAEAREAGALLSEVYPSAVGASFYGPVAPPGTVRLATCFNSILWMDHPPAIVIPDYPLYRRPNPPRPGLTVPAATEAAFAGQADREWVRFLECRAAELLTGGKLIVGTPGAHAGRRCSDGVYDVFNDALCDLMSAGRVEQSRCERLLMPLYFRTTEELLAPLVRADSPVRGAFRVDHCEAREAATPFEEEFERTGDRVAHAEAYTNFLRAFSEPVARPALVSPDGDPAVIDELYRRVRDRLIAEPERYRYVYVVTAVVLTRT